MRTMRAAVASLLSVSLLLLSPGYGPYQAAAQSFSARTAPVRGAQPGVAAFGPGAVAPLPVSLDAGALAPSLLAVPSLEASPASAIAAGAAASMASDAALPRDSARSAASMASDAALPRDSARSAASMASEAALPAEGLLPSAKRDRALPAAEEKEAGPATAAGLRSLAGTLDGKSDAASLSRAYDNGALALAAPNASDAALPRGSARSPVPSALGLLPSAPVARGSAAAVPAGSKSRAALGGFAPLALLGLSLPILSSGVAAWVAVGVLAGAGAAFLASRLFARPVRASAPVKMQTPISVGVGAGENLAALQADIAEKTAAAPAPKGPAPRIAVVAASRLPQGKFPGSFQSRWTSKKLGAYLVEGLLRSAGLAGDKLETLVKDGVRVKVLFGSVDSSDSPNVGREVAVEARLPVSVPGTGIGKNCGTSLEAVSLGMAELLSGRQDIVVAGGAEVMSRLPQVTKDPALAMNILYVVNLPGEIRKASWSKKPLLYLLLAWNKLQLAFRLAVSNPRYAIAEGLSIDGINMARTAQTLADALGISRDEQDWYAFRSQSRAAAAYERGDFADESLPFYGKDGHPVAGDQGVRHSPKRESYRKLPSVFGTKDVTPGNASQISDGASGVVLMTEQKAKELGLVPLAYLRAAADVGVEPRVMGLGPAYAIPLALKQAGVALADVEAVEVNEAFAAQTLAVLKALGISRDKVNPLGGAIAVGHPLAASGTRILATLAHHMARHGLTTGVCSLCVGGGEGSAAVLTRDPNGIPSSVKEKLRAGLRARGVSAAVAEKVVQILNGLPPLISTVGGAVEYYAAVHDFLIQAAALAPEADGAEVYSFFTEALSMPSALAGVDARFSADDLAFLGSRLAEKAPGFAAAFAAEYGAYSAREALARFAIAEAAGGGARLSLSSYPDAAREVLRDALAARLGSLSRDTLLGFVFGAQPQGGPLPENGSYKRRLDKVLDLVRRDQAAFGVEKDAYRYFKVSTDKHGTATIVISRAPINALNLEVGEELRSLLDALESDKAVRSVVFTAEGDLFVGGADLTVIAGVADPVDAEVKSRSLQELFDRIEGFPKPVVMAANGDALGGGVEIFMAGHLRMASARSSFTLPEMALGFLPGAGGTQRAVRLMGLTKGLTFMNMGPAGVKDAFAAKADGLVDRVSAPADLLRDAQEAARTLADMNNSQRQRFFAKARALSRPIRLSLMEKVGVYAGWGTLLGAAAGVALTLYLVSGAWLWATVPVALLAGALAGSRAMPGDGAIIRWMVRKEVLKSGHPEYVANVMNIIDAALEGVKNGPRSGLSKEAELFGRLAVTPLARFMVALTLRKTGGPKMEGVSGLEPAPIKKAAVAGAGVMGAAIAQLALYRDVPVVVKEDARFPQALESGLGRIRGLFQGLVKKDKYEPADVDLKMALVTGTVDDAVLAASKPDIVIEAVKEDLELKRRLFAQWGRDLPPETILASNTSALPITELAKASGRPGKVVGIHYFNPPHVLPLAELVLPDTADFTVEQKAELNRTVATVLAFLKKTGRIVVIVKDRPGFVVNRILAPYINEANRLLEEGASVEQVDRAMKKLGFPMGPLELADFVGLFLGKEVGEYLGRTLPHMAAMSPVLPALFAAGATGQKAGRGYYLYKTVKDRKTGEDRPVLDKPNQAAIDEILAAMGARAAIRGAAAAADGDDLPAVRKGLALVLGYLERFLSGKEWGGWTARELRDFDRMGDAELRNSLEHLKTSLAAAERALDAALADPKLSKAPLLQGYASFARHRRISDREIEERLIFAMDDEGRRIVEEGVVASPTDVDIALTTGAGFPTSLGGLMRHAAGRRAAAGPADPGSKTALAGTALFGLLALSAYAWWAPAAGVAAALAVYFLARRFFKASAGDSALEAEAKSMSGGGGDRKAEVFFPDLYRGFLDLDALSAVKTDLSPEARERVDAMKALVRIGFWPKGMDEGPRREALAALDRPTPAMERLLDELGLTAERVRSWEVIADPHQIDLDNDIPPEVMGRMVELGLDRLKKPGEYGGLGMHQLEYGEILQAIAELGISSVATDVSVANTIGYAPQAMFGTAAQKAEYLNRRGMAAFGLTEPGAGTDTKKVATTATLPDGLDVDLSEFAGVVPRDRREARDLQSRKLAKITRALQDSGDMAVSLTGEKIFITGLIDANVVYVVAGRTMWRGEDLGPSVFIVDLPFTVEESWADKKGKLVDLDARGMRVTPFTRDGFRLPVIRGSDQTYIQFKDFEVPADRILGKVGEGIQVPLKSLNAGRIGFGPVLTRAAAWFASRMLEWATDREMFDMYKEKGSERGYQADMEYAQTKIGAAHRKVAALQAVSRMTSALADANPDMGVAALSAAIKARVASQNWEIAQDARELGGGHALMEGAPGGVERESRYAWIFKIVEGVDPAMQQAVHLFAGFAVRAELMTLFGGLKFIWNQIVARLPLNFLVHNRGILSASDAKWIQKRAARLAFRFGTSALLIDMALSKIPFLRAREFGRRQNTLIHAYGAEMDLFTLAAVLVKLKKEGARLSPEERLSLESAAKVLRIQIDQQIAKVSPWGDPIEETDRKLGEAVVAAERARKGARPDLVARHMDWIRESADRWWQGLETR